MWMTAFLFIPMRNWPSLNSMFVFFDQLSNGPKSGTVPLKSFKMNLTTLSMSCNFNVLMLLHGILCMRRTSSKKNLDTEKGIWSKTFPGFIGNPLFGSMGTCFDCAISVFSLQNTCLFQISCTGKAWWKRSCSGVLCFLLAQYAAVFY